MSLVSLDTNEIIIVLNDDFI